MKFSRTIFLTGFPGFIAKRLVSRLAAADMQFFLLVEERMTDAAISAAEQIANETGMPLDNFALITGDITKADLGISIDDLAVIRDDTTDVFHLAAVYDLAVAENIARAVNFEGTRNVNELVRSLPNLQRYNYISTCYVAGRRTGRILETELEHNAGFRNFYEETKYLAELEVEKLRSDLPVTIFRPSVVVGDSKTGETLKYDGVYYLINYLRMAPSLLRLVNVGNSNVRLNLVPVDFVVDAIAVLSSDENAVGKTFALADPAPLTTAELFDVLAEKMTGKRSVIKPPPALIQNSLLMPVAPPVTGLPHSAVPYFFLAQTYDTAAAGELLKPYGIQCPNFREYAGNL
ncbi:MAG TPA: SDR family oxidoreductase, partial [Pyrinomonadaceae bacterium]|nr:SDR family oxidoreductase [Pyrinomonadaceae bacterium]